MTQGEFCSLTPRELVDGLDWPQLISLYMPPEKQPAPPGRGERVLSEKEFKAALAARKQKREEAKRGQTA